MRFALRRDALRPRWSLLGIRPPMIRKAPQCTIKSAPHRANASSSLPRRIRCSSTHCSAARRSCCRSPCGKGRAVIGGNVGGIRHQIAQGQSGYLVSDVDQAAATIAALLHNPAVRRNIGRRARERVRRHFLLTRLLEEWIDLLAQFVRKRPMAVSAQEPAILA
jgi:Glycosyl transferases group 1